MKRIQNYIAIACLLILFGSSIANGQIKVAVYPDIANSQKVARMLNSGPDIQATVVSTYDAAALAEFDVLMNIRGQNLAQDDVLEFIRNGGTWIGEWYANAYPINNWGVISSSGPSKYYGCCTNKIEIIDESHYLVQNVDWANLPLGANSTQFMRNLMVINDPDANIIVKAGINGRGAENPLLVEKDLGLGKIMLLNWDYADDPAENSIIQDLIQEMIKFGAGQSQDDKNAPVFAGVPDDLTTECNAVPGPATVTATDDTDGAVAVEFTEVKSDEACANSYKLTRTWSASDAAGNSATATQVITVQDNTAPAISGVPTVPVKVSTTAEDQVSCGVSVDFPAITASDNCGGEVTLAYSVAGNQVSSGAIFNVGDTEVTVTATDICGNETNDLFTVSVIDAEAPVIVLQPFTAHLDQNGRASITPEDVISSVTDNCGVADIKLSKSFFTCSHTGENEILVTATDVSGNHSSAVTVVTVVNDDPQIHSISLPAEPVAVTNTVNATASFTDVNAQSARWSWGDGETTEGMIAGGEISGSYTYATPGIYTVTLELTDVCGETTSLDYQYLIVIDPNGGFVTGGGWIWSSAGSYMADASTEGKANFGFVAKYNRGSNKPVGNVEFNFKNAGLNFHSTSFEWLVVSGDNATVKGEGRINNRGNYGFYISAKAGEGKGKSSSSDMFRIRIWDALSGTVIYDNQLGDDIDAEAIHSLDRGSIQIHKRGNSKNGRVEETIAQLNVDMFPNPASSGLNVQVHNDNTDEVKYTVYDINGNIVRHVSDINTTFIDVADLKAGVYMLLIESTQGVKRERFIKSNP